MPRTLIPHTSFKSGRATFRFYLGDCLDVLSRMDAGSVDVIVTSPPYNLGIRYRTYDDTMPRREYLDWTGKWVQQAARVLSPDSSLFLNVGAKPTDPWTALDVAQAVRPHLHLQNTIHWIKSIAIEKSLAGARAGLTDDLAVGHYKPINSRRFVHDCHEFVFHFSGAGDTPLDRQAIGVRYQDQSNIGRWRTGASGVRCRGNTWFIPYETIQSREKDRPHPATFPPKLPEMCLKLHGLDRARVVADPFLGLGSTAVACAQLGVSFIGIEMDEGYLKEAIERTRAALPAAPARTTRVRR
ncbi:MAG TPA: site-specific DNA-methyltransferase [Vicinamibacterales bacterium]|nr:site-specific DNA-methyltransferase [Vicinamibacterales bacterium]